LAGAFQAAEFVHQSTGIAAGGLQDHALQIESHGYKGPLSNRLPDGFGVAIAAIRQNKISWSKGKWMERLPMPARGFRQARKALRGVICSRPKIQRCA
jgi:hypothetical protein